MSMEDDEAENIRVEVHAQGERVMVLDQTEEVAEFEIDDGQMRFEVEGAYEREYAMA